MDDRERALSALQALDPGCNRETWVRIAMAAKAAGLDVDDFVEWSTSAHNFGGDRECRSLWKSIETGAVKGGTLFYMARGVGWSEPAKSHQRRPNGHGSRPLADVGTSFDPPLETPNVRVAEFWNGCEPASAGHAYIIAKRGRPDGLRVVSRTATQTISGKPVAGWLVIPARSMSGDLRTLQLIPTEGGGKLNFPGARFADGLHIVGDAESSKRLLICEGIGQAWTCFRATGCASVVTFGAGRMDAVAKALRAKWADKPLVLVSDRGKEAQVQSVAKLVRGSWVELPADKPDNYDINDYGAEYGDEIVSELLAAAKFPAMRYRLLGATDLTNVPPLVWLVRGIIPSVGLACIFGQSGTGKSFLALDLGAAVAAGVDWFCCRVSRAPVVYAALEGETGFIQRAKAWESRAQRNLPPTLRFVMQPFDLREPGDVDDLAEAVIASGSAGGLLVLDTLNRAASGADENSSADMGEIIESAKTLQRKVGGLVLLIHHSGKDQSRGMRGHSSLHAALDAAIEVSRTDERRSWRIAKSKDDCDATARQFQLVVVEVGEHEDGEPITSCVVEPDDMPQKIRRMIPPKSGNQAVAYQAVAEELRIASAPTAGLPVEVPPGRPVVALERAIAATADRLTCDRKRRTERAQQAITGLQAKQLIAVRGGYVWMT